MPLCPKPPEPLVLLMLMHPLAIKQVQATRGYAELNGREAFPNDFTNHVAKACGYIKGPRDSNS